MATRQRKAQHPVKQPPPEQEASATEPAWRQRPPETRERVRRQQMVVQRAKASPGNRLAPVIAQALELGESMALRHWMALLVLAAAVVGISQLLMLSQFTVTAATIRVR